MKKPDPRTALIEDHLRREANRRGLLLRKSRRRNPAAEDYGMYVLVDDTAGNQRAQSQAVISAFANGEGRTLQQISEELQK